MRTHSVENLTDRNLVLCGGQFRVPAGKVGFVPDSLWGHSDLVLALSKGLLRKYKPVASPEPVSVPVEPPVEVVARRRGRPKRSGNDEDKDNAG